MREIISMQDREGIPTLDKAFEDFIAEKIALKSSDATINSYRGRYKAFTEYFSGDHLCSDVSSTIVFQFVIFLQERNPDIKTVTINTYLRHIRAIFYSFMNLGYMNKFQIKMLRCEQELIETYSEAELERLLKKPDRKTCSFSEYRNWVMICYFLGTGIRLGTLSNLKIQDIDFENHEVSLRKVKNKKQYTIPITSSLEQILIEYLRFRKGKPEDYLFCSQYGSQLQKDSITTSIYRYNRSRGVLKTSVHQFRHTFAKNWILNRGDPFRLKAILGHSNMEMVNNYVNMFGKDLHKDFDIFNPLENMKAFIADKTAIRMQ